MSPGLNGGNTTVTNYPFGDWICWQRQIDPVTGIDSSQTDRQANITWSGLAPYLNIKVKAHKTAQEANQISGGVEEVFRCPSDNTLNRYFQADGNCYRYSY